LNQDLFQQACDYVLDKVIDQQGVGTLQEKTIHAVLKHYYAPDRADQEQKVEGFVADILQGNDIIEIQTRNFSVLRRKLEAFLPKHPVKIVYPVCHKKWLRWINMENGEISAPRKSPKTGNAHAVFPELYKIKMYLEDPNLSVCVILLDVEEYRLLNGWSNDRKRGSERNDGIPIALYDEILLKHRADYAGLIPEDIKQPFTTADYRKAAGVSARNAGIELNILHHIGAVSKVGKKGNFILYERV